jgi:hypothetical protein
MAIQRAKYSKVSPFSPRPFQQEFLIDNPIDQLRKYYNGEDSRSIVLNAITGSGKTTAAILGLIPEWIRQFYPEGKSVIGFMTHFLEVVEATYEDAKAALDYKTVETSAGNAKIRVYSSEDIKHIIKTNTPIDGDIIIVLITADFFSSRIEEFASDVDGFSLDLMIVDEAHFRFGTINAEDTRADKGTTNRNFVPVTLTQLRERVNCATIFMTATPTNSQREYTPLGAENNIYLPEFPSDANFIPAYSIVEYPTNDFTVEGGIGYFGDVLSQVEYITSQISEETWEVVSPKITKIFPASIVRLARRGAKNGVDFEENIDRIEMLQRSINAVSLTSTAKHKVFGGSKIFSLNDGIKLAKKYNSRGICINVIDSGYAGLNLPKINNIIIGREPSGIIANNYIQIGGRGARMVFFPSHNEAIDYIRGLPVSAEQKRWLAEYIILMNTTTVHVPADSDMLTIDVRNFFEEVSYRPDQLRSIILNGVFSDGNIPGGVHLSTYTTLQNDEYKQFQKDDCEVCAKSDGVHTDCFMLAWEGLNDQLDDTFRARSMVAGLFGVTEDIAKKHWLKVLNVHHIDGNHFNNDPSNLLTVCPNVHGMITMHGEDYLNRYPEIRNKLLDISDCT